MIAYLTQGYTILDPWIALISTAKSVLQAPAQPHLNRGNKAMTWQTSHFSSLIRSNHNICYGLDSNFSPIHCSNLLAVFHK